MIEELIEPLVPDRFRNDERYRDGHVRIINALPGRRILGAHIPDMVSLAKSLAGQDDVMDIIARFEAAASEETQTGRRDILSHEEMMVWGMMINNLGFSGLPEPGTVSVSGKGMARSRLKENQTALFALKLELLRRYVPYIDNWAVCDHVAGAAKWFGRAVKRSLGTSGTGERMTAMPEETEVPVCESLWQFLCGYFASDREFEVRFATVMAMSHFLNERYLPRIFYRFDSLDFSRIRSEYHSPAQAKSERCGDSAVALGEPPYYVRMGVAWCLATALAKFPDETRAYLRHSLLPENVVRLYVRKARESFRTRSVSPF